MSAARAVTFAAGPLKSAGGGMYRGFALRDISGVASVVRLWDSANAASGQLLDTIQLPANTDDRFGYPDGGIFFASGVFAEVVSGAVEGLVHIG